MKPGCLVKIEDIGKLARCIAVTRKFVELELEGHRFKMPKRLCKVVR